MPGEDETTRLDVALVQGFSFACRPDCGLCCFASPRISPDEQHALRVVAPQATLVGRGRDRYLSARPDGGACQFLANLRCGVHAQRPAPCREFPITVHLGERLQASVVLSCPGLDLRRLTDSRSAAEGAVGLAVELASVERRIDRAALARREEALRRRRRIVRALDAEGLWRSEEEVRAELRSNLPLPGPGSFPVEDPPSTDDGLETLPLFFDHRPGPVAIAGGLGGWHLLELASTGGVARDLGIVPPPTAPPRLDDEATTLLRGYLDYWLARDALFGYVLRTLLEGPAGDVVDAVADELSAIGALTLARASVRARLAGRPAEPLTERDVADGIRAVDADLLDRPSWGDRL